eukprot:gnl/Spiro4/2030_TR982_c0_g1_i1.p2 gnl/Spiro4/2030_TR982_c0_g1~~gnl/Spiro4/2030_TR982_c0_g1_i1.p2  ORF type:complete len:204 (+),score=27.28 gnl/Spiro4/2030_TR982_c0_g1_i1:56-613(+)
MRALCQCFGLCLDSPPAPRVSPVKFSSEFKAEGCVVSNFCIGGKGTCFANTPVMQMKAFFELKVLEEGVFVVGICAQGFNLTQQIGSDPQRSWGLSSADVPFAKDDIVGVAFDQSERPTLRFFKNGRSIDARTITFNAKGMELFPAVSVSGGAMLEANFTHSFVHRPPPGYDGIIRPVNMMPTPP